MPRALRVTSFATVAVLAVALAACGSSGSKASSTKPTTTTTVAPATSPTTISTANALASAPPPGSHFAHTLSFVKIPNGGLVLVAPNGRSLYLFDKDHGTTSACTGACTHIWPAFAPSGTATVAPGLQQAKVTKASNGQVAYNGHLLYYFSGDRAPGDTNGVTLPGWHVVSPLGFGMAGR
jgi:predicted lipoprotein with Yx(FWY)xxD motif